jgi:serine phosphatase RsbU (regulator of sigma subunit)
MTIYYVLETHTPYLFALSTFINISTLEARVKSLSIEVAEAREIEKDMALGQTIQKSFMQTPFLPERFGFAHQNEAAVYVSGDIFFVHWDEERQVLTAILNDVTGHGVQAALKASICTAMAESIWANKHVRGTDDPVSSLEIYDRRLHAFMDKINSMGEVVSIVGCEFDERAQVLRLYRVHGVFPVVIARKPDGSGYTIAVVPLQSGVRFEIPWPEDSFVLLMSDGLVDSSRTMRKLYLYLHQHLDVTTESFDEADIKGLFFQFSGFEKVADDKTLLVVHRRLSKALPALKAS